MHISSSQPGRLNSLKHTAIWVYLVSLLLLASLIVASAPKTAFSADNSTNSNVKMTARSLFQGYFKFGDWLPIEVSLENFGEATDVQIKATVITRISGVNYSTTYTRETSLAERANKKVELYIIPYVETTNASRSINYDTTVTLTSGNKKLAEEKVDLAPFSPIDYLVGVFNPDPNALTTLNNLKVGGSRTRVSSVNLDINDIPDSGLGLKSFNALIISDVNTEALSAEQRTALNDWVEAGGQLILMGGNGWNKVKAGINSSLLPYDVNNYVNISNLDGLISPAGDEMKTEPLSRPTVIALGQKLKDANLLSYIQESQNAIPIVVEKRIGEGRVVASSLDFASTPLAGWSGANQIWQELFNFNITPYSQSYNDNNPQIKNNGDMLGLVSNVPDLHLPDIMPFLILLLIYLVVVAPINFIALKKFHKLELAWITVPAITIVFTFLALNYANSRSPGQVLISQLSVVQSGYNQETAQLLSYAAVFSPDNKSYDVTPVLDNSDSLAHTLMTPLNRTTTNLGDSDPNRTAVQGEKPRFDSFQVGQWNAQGFTLQTEVPVKPFQLAADLHYEDNRIIGTIRNTTGNTIRQSLLLFGDSAQKLRDTIEPGESVNVDFTLPSPTAAVPASCSTGYSGSSAFAGSTPADRISALLQQDHKDDKLSQTKINFLRKIYENGRYSPVNNQRGLDIIGWLDNNPVQLEVSNITTEAKSSQALIYRLPVGLETSSGDGRLTLPAMANFPTSAVSSSGQSAFTNRVDRTDEICVSRGSVTVEYRLPGDPTQFKVKKLTLYVNSFTFAGTRPPAIPDSFELYDFQAKTWKSVPNVNNSAVPISTGSYFSSPPTPVKNVVEDAGRYADPVTGRILLRVTNSSSNSTLFVQHSLEVEGTRN
ncbi:MAG TPA: hypothetical protein VH186_24405 [Chloroflexia bacterium]|nr:hypothetical protein [Chloroflexia bacterium]